MKFINDSAKFCNDTINLIFHWSTVLLTIFIRLGTIMFLSRTVSLKKLYTLFGLFVCLNWGLMSQSTVSQSCWERATCDHFLGCNQYSGNLMCLVQGCNKYHECRVNPGPLDLFEALLPGHRTPLVSNSNVYSCIDIYAQFCAYMFEAFLTSLKQQNPCSIINFKCCLNIGFGQRH